MVGLPRSTTVHALLRLTMGLLLAAVCLLGYRAITRPTVEIGAPQTSTMPDSRPIAEYPLKPVDWYAPIWQRDLRQPPIPPKLDKKANTPQAPPPSLPRLLGTFVEPDTCWAHFLTSDGRMRVCKVNETIGTFRVVAVEPGRAQLALGADLHWVDVPRPKSRGSSQ